MSDDERRITFFFKPMMLSDNHLPSEYAETIGRIVVMWSYIEAEIVEWLSELMGVDEVDGRQLAKILRVPGLISAVSLLAKRNYPDGAAEIDTLVSDVRTLENERNNVVHDLWLRTETHEAIRQPRRDEVKRSVASKTHSIGGIPARGIAITREELDGLLLRMESVYGELFFSRFRGRRTG